MSDAQDDAVREARIHDAIIVDAYGPEEQALGWYYYLERTLSFPFRARCATERRTSPLRLGDEVRVVGMPAPEDCEREMFVLIKRGRARELAVPLAQLEAVDADDETLEAIGDWHYWVRSGYVF